MYDSSLVVVLFSWSEIVARYLKKLGRLMNCLLKFELLHSYRQLYMTYLIFEFMNTFDIN